MNILIPSLSAPIIQDIAQCLETIKQSAQIAPLLWDTQQKSLMDAFDETQPSIVFLNESQLDGAFAVACQNFDFKYILSGQNELSPELPKRPAAIITAPSCSQNFASANCAVMVADYAASVAQIHNAQYDSKMQSEILICTSNMQVSDEQLNIISFLTSHYNTKIIGSVVVPSHHYLGQVNMVEKANFMKSAKIIIDFTGHEIWNAAYLRIPTMCQYSLYNHFLSFHDISTLKTNIDVLLNDEKIRTEYIAQCYIEMKKGRTYHHFSSTLFNAIGEPRLSSHLLSFIEEALI